MTQTISTPHQRIERAAARDATRAVLTNVIIDPTPDGYLAWASDSYIIAAVPVKTEARPSEQVLLPAEALKQHWGGKKNVPPPIVVEDGWARIGDGSVGYRVGDGSPPDLSRLSAGVFDDPTFRVGLNATYLARLASAIGSPQVELVVKLSKGQRGESAYPLTAIGVKPLGGSDAYGLIMPVRLHG